MGPGYTPALRNIPPSALTPGAANTVLWTNAALAVSWSGVPILATALSVAGATGFPAAAGAIRLPNGVSGNVAWRNAVNGADAGTIGMSVTNVLTFSCAGGVSCANSFSGSSSVTAAGLMSAGTTLSAVGDCDLRSSGGGRIRINGTGIGFNGTAAIAKPTIVGSRLANPALADLLTQLAAYGLITDGTVV